MNMNLFAALFQSAPAYPLGMERICLVNKLYGQATKGMR
jgi:hypothetical protein